MSVPILETNIPNIEINTFAHFNEELSVHFSSDLPITYQINSSFSTSPQTEFWGTNTMPDGVTWDPSTGVIGGAPTNGILFNSFLTVLFIVTAITDSGSVASNPFTLQHNPYPPIMTSDCPDFNMSDDTPETYNYTNHFTGDVSFTTLLYYLPVIPAGVTLSSAGVMQSSTTLSYAADESYYENFRMEVTSAQGGKVLSNAFSIQRWKTPVAVSIPDQTFINNDYVNIALNSSLLNGYLESALDWNSKLPADLDIVKNESNDIWYLTGFIHDSGVHPDIAIRLRNPAGTVFIPNFTFTVITDPISYYNVGPFTNKVGDVVSYSVATSFAHAESYGVSGSLPDGLSLDPVSGLISGTVGGSVGTYSNIILSATNNYGPDPATVFKDDFDWFIVDGPNQTQTFTNITSDSEEVISIELSEYFGAADSYALASGTLPTTITVNTGTGLVSGTIDPQFSEVVSAGISFSATNTTSTTTGETITWTVRQIKPEVAFQIDDQSTIALTNVTFSVASPFFNYADSYSSTGGDLPEGLSLIESTGVVTGTTLDETKTYNNIIITATNDAGSVSADPFIWEVGQPPNLNPTANYNIQMTPGVAVNISLQDYFGRSPAGFVSTGNTLPAGLDFEYLSGAITGTPTATSPTVYFDVRYLAVNDFGSIESLSMTWTMFAPPTKKFDIASQTSSPSIQIPDFQTSVYFTGVTSYSLSQGALPTGLFLNTSTGAITGTPSSSTLTYPNIKIQGSNGDGVVESNEFDWTIGSAADWSGVNIEDRDGVPGQIVSFNVSQYFVNKPTLYSIASGVLPAGVSIDSSTGSISGSLADDLFLVYGNISIQGSNGLGSGITNSFNWTVNGAKLPTFSGTLPDLASEAGQTINYDVSGFFGESPTDFEFVSASPTGLTISSAGLITGELTDIVDYDYSVKIRGTNTAGYVESNIFSWFITGNLSAEQKFYRDWLADEGVHRVLLVEAYYTSTELGADNLATDEVFGESMFINSDEIFGENHFSGVAEGVERMSTAGYITHPTDSPSNTEYEDVVVSFPNFRRSMSEALEKKSTQSYGDIIITNVDGERDHWLDRSWNGRQVTLKLGDPSWNYSQFETILEGTSLEMTTSGRDKLVLKLGDKGLELERKIEPAYISQGSSKDKMIPLVYGSVTNMSPPLSDVTADGSIDKASYAISYKPIDEIVTVYSNGNELTEGPGWSVYAAGNEFILNENATGKITCDVKGGVATVGIGGGGGSYIDDIASIIHEIVISNSSLTVDDINTVSFQNFRTAYPQKCGIQISTVVTVSSILDRLISSVGGWWGFGRDGKLMLGVLEDPELLQPRLTITTDEIVSGGISMKKRYLPIKQVTLGYDKNETVMEEGDLAGVLDVDRKAELGIEWKEVRSINELTGNTHLLSTETGLLETVLTDVTEATAESLRRLELRDQVRTIYQIDAFATPFSIELGDVINIVHPRFGFEDGKKCVVVGYSESITPPRIKLDVWK